MTKIIFITSGRINYELPNLSLYESIEKVAKGEVFPHIINESKNEILRAVDTLKEETPIVIFSAPSFQTRETAEIFSRELNVKIETFAYLLPLRFNLKNMLSQSEFNSLEKGRFNELRKQFLNDFFENILIDQNIEVKNRFEKLKTSVLKKYKGQTILVVSHAYLIKLFSIYYKVGDEMFKNKAKLFDLFQPSKEPLGRLERLEITI